MSNILTIIAIILPAIGIGIAVYAFHLQRSSREALVESTTSVDEMYKVLREQRARMKASLPNPHTDYAKTLIDLHEKKGSRLTATEAQEILDSVHGLVKIGNLPPEVEGQVTEMLSDYGVTTPGVPVKDDPCPECGEMFASIDDYLCPDCRAKMDAS